MRLLLLGRNGQVGQQILHKFKLGPVQIDALSRRETDIASVSAVRDALTGRRPDVVVNVAAFTKVDLAEANKADAWRSNCDGPAVVAQECASMGIPLVHLSTDYVFDGSKSTPYVETDSVNPINVYGASKEAGERAVRELCPQHIILRTSWVYGPFGANFVKSILRLAAERESLGVVADQFGNPTSTADLADGVMAAAERAMKPACPWGTYHFAGDGDTSWHGFAEAIILAAETGLPKRPKVLAIATADYPTAARRPANSRLDCSQFEIFFGLRAAPWRKRVGQVVRDILLKAGEEL